MDGFLYCDFNARVRDCKPGAVNETGPAGTVDCNLISRGYRGNRRRRIELEGESLQL